MATSKLKLYNAALRMCGERRLASLTEDREPRRLLDDAWDENIEDECLEAGQWKFAMRTVKIDYDTSISPDFGLRRAFEKPSDWVVTSALCSDEYFDQPLLQYVDEAGYWYADIDEIYVRYVSNDSGYGGDLSLWTNRFARYVASRLAGLIILKLTSDDDKQMSVIKLEDKYLSEAKSVDAMAEPTKFPPEGGWNMARRRGSSRRDRGSRSSLIG